VQIARTVQSFLKSAWTNLNQHSPFQAAAALSYYSLFSLAPLVIIIVAIAGFLISDADIQSELVDRVREFANEDAAQVVQTIVENSADEQRSALSIAIATILMIIGSTTAFAQLHSILNQVWNVPVARRRSIWLFFKGRLLSFLILIIIGVLLAASLVFNTFLSNVGDFVAERFGFEMTFWAPLNLMTSYGVTTVLIATIYKYLPDAPVHWIDALAGAVAASLLLELSKWGVEYYVAQLDPESLYGAAGSVFVFLLWVYVAALIVLIGTEISRTFSEFRRAAL
jgi:membrane protein